jgi:multidrug efflux pump subunit AcrA (membrane-fusion protein)
MYKRTKRLWFAVGILLAVLLTACVPGATPEPQPTPTFWPTAVVPEKPTYTVERGTIVDSLTFTARMSPLREAELYFRTDGRVLDVYVSRGDLVQAGDRLAELDVAALYRQLAQLELALETAQTDLTSAESELAYNLDRARLNLALEQIALKRLQDYDPDLELAVAKEDLRQAELDLQTAQARYDAVSHAPDISMRPEADALQQATLAYTRAKAAYDQAVRESDQRVYDIQSQQKRVELSQLEVARLEAGVDPRLEQAVIKAELDLADLQAQITDTLIVAPFDGEVTAVSTAEGKAVTGYKPVIIVADPSELEARAELGSDDMKKLSEGQSATIVPIEYPGEELEGSIRALPYPYGSGGGVTDLDEKDPDTHLTVNLAGLDLEAGNLVRVTVILEHKDDVLWLPPAAIRTFEGRKFVVVQEDGGQRQVDVILGIESEDRIEIESGLEEGRVVIGP